MDILEEKEGGKSGKKNGDILVFYVIHRRKTARFISVDCWHFVAADAFSFLTTLAHSRRSGYEEYDTFYVD